MSQLAAKANLASKDNTTEKAKCLRRGGKWKKGWFGGGHCEELKLEGGMGIMRNTGKRKGKRSYKKHKTTSPKGKKKVRRSSHVKRNKK